MLKKNFLYSNCSKVENNYTFNWCSANLFSSKCSTSLVAQTVKCLSTMQQIQVRSLGQEDPLEKEMANHSSTIAGKSHVQRNLVGYSPWGRKESDTTEQLHLLKCSRRLSFWFLPGDLTINQLFKIGSDGSHYLPGFTSCFGHHTFLSSSG